MKRLYHLKALQEERNAAYEAYKEERVALERRYSEVYSSIYAKRANVVNGRSSSASVSDGAGAGAGAAGGGDGGDGAVTGAATAGGESDEWVLS
ncbi:unnamed protein product [Choristocarpus tenellus]